MIVYLSALMGLVTVASNPFVAASVAVLSALLILEFQVGFYLTGINFSYSDFMEADWMGMMFLALLSYIGFLMMVISSQSSASFKMFELSLITILASVFLLKHIVYFYIAFELSLIPISLMILGTGYQPERTQATMYMILYTTLASMPLLAMIMSWSTTCLNSMILMKWYAHPPNGPLSGLIFMALMTAFMVKLPVYGFHMWLPKAHVEAPLEGSIILAGLLLKVGGFGMIVFMPLSANISSPLMKMGMSMAGMGGVAISALCVRVSDLKILIAYSSVSHMSLCLMGAFSQTKFNVLACVMVMIAHGVSSPAMFTGAYLLYLKSKSRNLLMNTAGASYYPVFTLFWFMVCLSNMAGPPTLNLVSELMSITGLWSVSNLMMWQMGMMIFLSGAYTLVAYSFTQHCYTNTQTNYQSSTKMMDLQVLSAYTLPLFLGALYGMWLMPSLLVY